MDQSVVIFVSVGSEDEGLTISRKLVEERLAACVNLVPKVRSIYRWEGEICEESESYLIIKTRQELFEAMQERIKGLHSYSVPEIIALPIVKGLDSYLEWILAETGSS